MCQRLYRKIVEEPAKKMPNWEIVPWEKKTKFITVYELLVNNDKLRASLRPDDNWYVRFDAIKNNLNVEWKHVWNFPMNDDIIEKIKLWDITPEEWIILAYDKAWLKEKLKKESIQFKDNIKF
jgi:hypothetical protein